MRLVAIRGNDAGIAAALRARELDPGAEVPLVLADPARRCPLAGSPRTASTAA